MKPFGLCNAPATFERLMERVLKDIPRTRCVVYLDDLLVHARDFGQAVHNLWEILTAIRSAGLQLNPAKCNLFTCQTHFLGRVVSESGVASDPTKVAAVRDWPPPTYISELRSFLGLASYYRRFIRDFATIASPLHLLTKGRRFGWSEDCAAALRQLKAALILSWPTLIPTNLSLWTLMPAMWVSVLCSARGGRLESEWWPTIAAASVIQKEITAPPCGSC